MSEHTKYSLLAILLGIICLYLGLTWKKPTYGGGIVQKYTSIVLGAMSLLYGIFSLF
jgi:hypothetical protein